MPGGLVALLDDVSIIARAAAASIDDVGVAASKAGTKAAGVVVDDAAVTPGYVTGLSPARELPIIWKITKGSLRNKLLILLPGALILSLILPTAIVFILMAGGCYLSFEGAEKIIEKVGGAKHGETLDDTIEDPVAFEKGRVNGAVRTDLILSAEIMAITLASVSAESFFVRAAVLAIVGVGITFLVYGAVGMIVKMDDVGLHLAKKPSATLQATGRFLLRAMPWLLNALSTIGTVAMLWVGGGIILHGLAQVGFSAPEHFMEGIRHSVEGATHALGGIFGWLTYAVSSAVFGLVIGVLLALIVHWGQTLLGKGGSVH
ncbi:MAG: DUF808 domain-containing protein [Tsuneonella suprasediminis]|uniref:DUF808 domain-containing protein n=1 Tax=Tsuneonella suprasediminis TaxID=2306996 RepID=A0A419R028_9SPHN|nr:DUF808 domain-containing protein [Tsuneonella suprasediminis]RJX66823.1 DUF808 domain-containing protein [Tsuneonella suprasediminis]UBS32388.1 DUF808 domain-containing protein [Altererythrobacter sp. N1]